MRDSLYTGTGAQIQAIQFDYRRSSDQDAARPVRDPIVVVGAGPVGLSLAIDLAQRGQRVLLLDNDNKLSTGSRAICFAKRTLEIWDRLGVGDPMVAKGVSWKVGKVFFRNELLYQFDLLPEPGHERPAFINLQQYYAEAYLVARAMELPNLEIRWRHGVCAVEQAGDKVMLGIDTPEGRYTVEADYVAACDGSRSAVRQLMGLESKGRVFRDRFLIADVRMKGHAWATQKLPVSEDGGQPARGTATGAEPERWFWFDPP
ncbi:MAG TPA: FAD-dependent oxidoreductase, partial [Burkholderiaceae bacterium]|nr:FAD-dependent oxidoreductase [Burkholderiaceae bacterium]